MFIRSLHVDNFMKLVAFDVDANGKHVIIRGRNGEGKTSAVEAIYEALQGSSAKDRPEPVHQGADKAYIRLDLGDYVVEKHIAADGKHRLVVKAADGAKINSPQKLLDGLLSQYSLDPVAFLDRRPQDQVDDVLRVCSIEPPVDQVEEITGEKCPPKFGESADQYMERLSADEVGEWYRRRREQHRIVETNRGAVEKQEQKVTQLGAQAPAECRLADVILAELEQATQQQKAYEEARKLVNDLLHDQTTAQTKLIEVDREQATLKAEIAKLTERLNKALERFENGSQILNEIKSELDEAQGQLTLHVDKTGAMRQLRQELSTSQSAQKILIEVDQAGKRLDELQAEHLTSQKHHAKLDQQLEQLRDLRKALLEGIDLGVDGLAVGQGELRLHGVSFKQASLAQKLRVACAVAMKGNGALRLIRIDNGEHLDSESREYLLKLATDQGWQVIMTCVADQQELGIEIVNGEVAPVEAKPVKRVKGKLFDDKLTANEAGM